MKRSISLLLVATCLGGCALSHRPPNVAEPPPVQTAPPAPVATPAPAPPPIPWRLTAARDARRSGEAAEAARLLSEEAEGPEADPEARPWVRLELGLLYADPESPLYSPEEARFHLACLEAEAPASPAAEMGEVVRRMLDQVGAVEHDAAAATEAATEAGQALAVARAALARREQELERIKSILLGETAP